LSSAERPFSATTERGDRARPAFATRTALRFQKVEKSAASIKKIERGAENAARPAPRPGDTLRGASERLVLRAPEPNLARTKRETSMASKAKSEAEAADPRGQIVEALMKLAGERRFEDIAIRDICKEAGVTLADFRDSFASKGAALVALSRRIDRAVLSEDSDELADESPRERLFDILMRRLEALAPYREGLRETTAWLRRDLSAALAMNRVLLGSMRFMLEAADIEVEDGAAGAIKLQGLALAWARIVGIWLEDDDPGLSKTMAELDKELTRGERATAGVDRLMTLAAPFRALAEAVFDARRRLRDRPHRVRVEPDDADFAADRDDEDPAARGSGAS
jgi:AcrR family transcriptional regulator